MFSYEGPLNFFNTLLGPVADIIHAGLPAWTREMISASLYEGIRMSQDLVYCRDWDLYQPITVRDDPFGRPIRPKKSSEFSPTDLSSYEIGGPTLPALNYLSSSLSPGMPQEEPGFEPEPEEEYGPSEDEEYIPDED